MDTATPTSFYRRAADNVMFFGSILTLIFDILIVVTTLILEVTRYVRFAEEWVILAFCSMSTGLLFSIGITLALKAEGQQCSNMGDVVVQKKDEFKS
ncbi:hypothetical protein E8E12_009444 [Didymella heteroderae]|uniref:Uncharacterized protein n=1 Tax=Didymella heteroderae TaxID=1769908 RepID=A0A9P4WVI7_9PLEO|nr:hypothetical protein E8E12_009444 [Didymella heteroderae]